MNQGLASTIRYFRWSKDRRLTGLSLPADSLPMTNEAGYSPLLCSDCASDCLALERKERAERRDIVNRDQSLTEALSEWNGSGSMPSFLV